MNFRKSRGAVFILIIFPLLAGVAWRCLRPSISASSANATARILDPVPPQQLQSPAAVQPAQTQAAVAPTPIAPSTTVVAAINASPALVSITRAAVGGGQETIHIVRDERGHYPLVRSVEQVKKTENGPVVVREQMVADHVMVRLQPGVTAEAAAAALPLIPGLSLRKLVGKQGHALLTFSDGASDPDALPRALAALNARKDLVRYAEPDFIVTVDATPNDTRYLDGSLWGLHNTGQTGGTADADIDAPEGWNTRTDASSVVVAIVDTGIRTTHEDLAANLWTNPGEIPGNGIDDDNNGYIDDVHGINAINGSGDPTDDNYHGTHVAGTIGAVGNNGKGVVGVAWNVKLLAVKFLSSSGSGATSDAVECIEYATDQGARVINNSWGGGSSSNALVDMIEYARANGAIMVVAAGNSADNNNIENTYPVNHRVDNIVGVAATTRSETLANFSNYGSAYVNVGAPGLDILSCGNTADDSYATLSGTSMATPQVSGVLAVLAAQFPTDNYSQLINRLYRSVDPTAALADKVQTGGRVNLQKALATTTGRPANDDFSTPYVITSSSLFLRSSNREATVEANEPNHGSIAADGTIWYQWTAPSNASVTVSTAGSQIDTTLAVFTGNSVGALTLLAANDDVSNSTASRVRIDPVSGTTYHIALGGKAGARGLVMVSLGAAPANDNFANAITISGTSFSVAGTTLNASEEIGEPLVTGLSPEASVWYNWTAPSSGTFVITTQGGTGFDSLLGVYTGSALGSLVLVAENDDLSASYSSSRVVISAVSGTTYRILIGGKNAGGGPLRLTISPPPSNDNFATAPSITGTTLPLSVSGYNRGASLETGEPEIVSFEQPGGTSIWWKWTALDSLDYFIDTIGSDYDSMLAVYTGTSVSNLLKVADNDDINGETSASRLTLPAVAGVTYYIRVDGWLGRSGSVNLKITAPVVGWSNDDFARATPLSGDSVTATGSNVGAGVEVSDDETQSEPKLPGQENDPIYQFDSVWWTWTAPATGSVRLTAFDFQGAGYYAEVLRLTNPAQPASFANLTSHAFKGGNFNVSYLDFTATRGLTYYLRIGHDNSAQYGKGKINFRLAYNPVLSNRPPSITGATLDAVGPIDSNQMLGVSALTAIDPENNPISYAYQWQRSTEARTWTDAVGSTGATVSPAPGYFWRVRIRPSDTTADGVWFTTESIAVDAAPVLSATYGQLYNYSSKLVVPAPLPLTRLPVVMNEVSKGTSGQRRWVELLTQQTVDLRDYVVRTSYGGAEVEFTDLPVWQNVPAGTLIVIYNSNDRDPALPPDDSDPSDGKLIIADNNKSFFSSTNANSFWGDTYLGQGNPNFLFQGRGLKVRKGANSEVFTMEWGGSSGTGLYVPTFQPTFGVGQSLRYIGGAPDSAEISSSWELTTAGSDVVSPGRSNSVINEDYVQRLRAVGSPPRFRLVTPIPPGLSFNTTTGTLSGTPSNPAGGTYPVTIERFHPYESTTRSFVLTVNPGTVVQPTIVSGQSVNVAPGQSLNYQLVSNNLPTSYSLVSGSLPPGVTFDPITGLLSGTPNAVGTYSATFTATNSAGTSPAVTVSFTIAIPGTLIISEPFEYAVGVNNPNPDSDLNGGNGLPATNVGGNPSGTGLRGDWGVTTDVVAGLNYTQGTKTLTTSGSAGRVNNATWGGNPYFYRSMTSDPHIAQRIAGASSGNFGVDGSSIYLSFLAQTSSSNNEAFNFSLRYDGSQNFFISNTPTGWALGGVAAANAPLALNTPTLMVVRMDFTPGATDTVSLWVNPPLGVAFGAPNATVSGLSFPGIGNVQTRSSVSNAMTVDEFRMGTSFDVVTPFVDSATAPVVSANQSPSTAVGDDFNYQILANSSPTSYALVSGSLPPGVTFNTTTGVLSGTPTGVGTYTPTFTATNAIGTSTPVVVTITVAAVSPPIVDEPFNYTAGTGALALQNGGSGWNSAWNAATNDINATGFTYSSGGDTLATSGGRMTIKAGQGSFRSFPTRYTSGTYWLSFLAKSSSPGNGQWGGLSLFDNGAERAFFGQPNANPNWAIDLGTTPATNSTANQAFIVVKIVLDPSGNDSAFLWVNPSLSTTPLEGNVANSRSGVEMSFDRLRLQGSIPVDFDEIRFGTSFSQVAPIAGPMNGLTAFRISNGLAMSGSQDMEDPAGDGVKNLLKYAFNMIGNGTGQASFITTPNTSVLPANGTAGLPSIGVETATGKLQITYIRRKADATPASGITYAVEFSDALGTWAENRSATESGVSIDDTFERVTVTDFPGIPGKRFARVRITNN